MKRLIICVCVIKCHTCFAGEFDRAINMTQRALRQTAPIKEVSDKVSRRAKKIVKTYNIPNWALATTGVAIRVLDSKEINSRQLAPKLKMDIGDARIQPTVRYNLESGDFNASFDLNMDF